MGIPHVRMRITAAVICVLALTAGCERSDPAKDAPVTARTNPEIVQRQATLGSPEGSVVEDFNRRVNQYMTLQHQLEGSLDKLSTKATPTQIDAHQRALLALVAKARADVTQGEIFVPDMQTFIKGLVRRVLTGPGGPKIKDSLMDENPMGVSIKVNDRYPDTIPLATMPPDILAALPKLPEDLEYRFVGNRLILLDTRAHLIVDLVPDTFDI